MSSPRNTVSNFLNFTGLDDSLKGKLVSLLQDQIAGLLARIDEEISNYSQDQEHEASA